MPHNPYSLHLQLTSRSFRLGQGKELALVALMEVWYPLLFVIRSAFQTSQTLTKFAFSWLSGVAISDEGGVYRVKQVFSITRHASKVSHVYFISNFPEASVLALLVVVSTINASSTIWPLPLSVYGKHVY